MLVTVCYKHHVSCHHEKQLFVTVCYLLGGVS
jgi:hypothetical protein